MEDFKMFCRICLKFDVRLHDMEKVSVAEEYQRILGVPLQSIHIPGLYACFECANILYKYKKFRDRCLHSYNLLSAIQINSFGVTSEQIKDISKNIVQLHSELKISHLEIIDVKYENETAIESILNLDSICKQENDVPYMDMDEEPALDIDDAAFKYESNEDTILPSEILPKEKYKKPKKSTKTRQTKVKIKKPSTKLETQQDLELKLETAAECDSYEDLKDFITNDVDYDSENDNKPLIKYAKKSLRSKIQSKELRDELEKEAIVEVLSHEQALQYVELRKDSVNYKVCPLKCDMCYRGFELQRTFENHMKKHSVECGPNICEFCKLRFKEKRHLDKHVLTCHKFKIVCKTCHYTCSGMQQARIHLNAHKGEMYACKDCDEKFRYPNSLLNHRHTKHPIQCVCEFCGNIFGTPRGLMTHKSLMHKGEMLESSTESPRCEACDVTFITEEAWKRHLVLSSRHYVENGCEQCGETFTNGEELKKHTSTAHSRPTIQRKYLYIYNNVKFPTNCKICGVQLKEKVEYKSHYKDLHPDARFTKRIYSYERKHVCEVCGKVFKHRFSLRYHQTKHSGEKPYNCKLCNARFSTPASLYQHKHKHTRTRKDNECDVCHKVLGGPSQLKKHKRTHLQVRPHQCSLCEKTFLNRCEVVQHIKHFHYKVPWPKRDRRTRRETAEAK